MIEFIIKLYKAEPTTFIGMVGLLFFVLLWIFFISIYIYTNIYIKEICKIIYRDEREFKRIMEPFDFFYLSMLPSAYWREILNIKFDTSFKAFYGNNVYKKIGDSQLKELLKNHPLFFCLNYLVVVSGILGTFLLFFAYFLEQYF
ncbi:hypothetical protein LF296_10650 [Acinetobacter vivianii]|uniref:Uncharacterized protein n=1 Tax=Acinetobacter vivianii TaxID=1776742 RepID=A0AAJ6P3X7_9GAMM|nr:hypothetical protein [Acinetobacter vivianii]WDZ49795.1 hypothetical protein LF296_10650 [Acinetobacter vivianii]